MQIEHDGRGDAAAAPFEYAHGGIAVLAADVQTQGGLHAGRRARGAKQHGQYVAPFGGMLQTAQGVFGDAFMGLVEPQHDGTAAC